ncbi:hypothetical protein QE250_16970, partial [Chromatiaceae bacterium AAb-1]|nr:hypothetical protein [Chromatiaceae bacterium AAb-1]
LNILRRLNLNLISSSGIDCDNFKEFIQLISMKIWHNPSFVLYKLTRKPLHSYHYSGITLLHSKTFGLNDTAESYLRRNLNHAEQLGYLSIATHYMTLKGDDRYRTEFYNLLDILIDRYGKDAFVLSRDLIKHVGRL